VDDQQRFPRVSIGLRVNGQLVSSPSNARFPIYSATKTLTAICILRLAEDGHLSLDDPIVRIVPDVQVSDAVTLKHLLRHTSGLYDYGDLTRYHADVRTKPRTPWTRAEFLESVLPRGVLFPPGHGWAYSNVGYMLLIDAIEQVTGKSFADAIARYVAEPLQLTQTSVLEAPADLERCEPGFGSEVSAEGAVIDVRAVYHPGWCAPRLVASTPNELSRVFDALLAGTLLSPASLERMLTLVSMEASPTDTSSIRAGMGIYCDESTPFGPAYHHGGGGPGYDISVTSYPDHPLGRVTIAAIVNSSLQPRAAHDHEATVVRGLFSRRV
jgi:D-alanyl-D-alanine carboxypeptidase